MPDPISVSNFKTGTYELEGNAVVVGDLWEEDLALSNIEWDAVTDIVPGTGIEYVVGPLPISVNPPAFSKGPAATSAHFAAIPVAEGFTCVMQGSLDREDDNFNFGLWLHDANFANFQYANLIADHSVCFIKDEDGNYAPTHLTDVPGITSNLGLHRFAFTMENGHMAISVDGGPVFSVHSSVAHELMSKVRIWTWHNGWASGDGTVVIEECTIYPCVTDRLLRLLSK